MVEFPTIDTGFRRYLYSRCCHSFFHCFGLRHHLAHLAVQEPAGASCAKTIFPPKSHRCWGTERGWNHACHVSSHPRLPFFLVKATPKTNLKYSKSAVMYNFSNPLLPLGHFYSLLLNCRYCSHPKSYPASPNPHLHSCQSHQSTGCFLSLDYYSQLHTAVPLSIHRGTHIYTSMSTHKHTFKLFVEWLKMVNEINLCLGNTQLKSNPDIINAICLSCIWIHRYYREWGSKKPGCSFLSFFLNWIYWAECFWRGCSARYHLLIHISFSRSKANTARPGRMFHHGFL